MARGPSQTTIDWTPEREERCGRLWRDGASAGEIAKLLGGITRNAVIGKVHRLGLARERAGAFKRVARNYGYNTKVRRPRIKAPPKQLTRPKPLPVECLADPVIPAHERKGVLDLQRHDCRWPIGDPHSKDFHFCARRQAPGSSYCQAHLQRSVAPPAAVWSARRAAA